MGTLQLQSNGPLYSVQQYSDWYTGHWWVGCYIWYSEEGTGWAVPNVTAHPSMASVSMNVLRCTTVNWCKASCAVFFHHVAVFSCHGCERFLTVSVSAEWHMRSLFLSAAAFNCIYWDKYCLWAGCWLLSTRHISRQRTGFHSFFISSFGN